MKIKQEHFIESIYSSLQYISYYHAPDFTKAMVLAYEKETNKSAKNAIAQILINSKMCALGKRPICQDTGIVNVFIEVGMEIQWEADLSLEEMVNEGVRRAYNDPDNRLRASIVSDPLFTRKNTQDNTPAVIHTKLVPGTKLDIVVAAKGSGSENKAKFSVLNPDDNLTDWVMRTIPTMGAGWCPPGIIGIGVGGTAEKAMLMAKSSLMEPIDINELQEKNQHTEIEALRIDLYNKINEIKKYYSNLNNDENFEKSLSILASTKKEIFDFFDNVKVNEENEDLRKNRLELINMLCKTFQNFMNFQLLKTNNE